MNGRENKMKRLIAGDKPVTQKKYTGTMKTMNGTESAAKKTIPIALAIVILPFSFARAEDKAQPSPHAAASGASASSTNRILPPDVLVRNVLLPAWRDTFRSEVKSWYKKDAALLDQVSVKEDEKLEPFAEAAYAESERAAPPQRDRPFGSSEL